jgi:hypothetical protein
VLAAGLFALAAFHSFGRLTLASSAMLPDVDTTLLTGFGVGQGAYLFKKAAMPLNKG